MRIVLYQSNIIKIGGVETLLYNLCEQLKDDYDIVVVYKECDYDQLMRLSALTKCVNYSSFKTLECDICICMSSWGGYPDKIISSRNEYWQMIHANYKELLKENYFYNKWSKTTKHIAVSKSVAKTFKEIYKIDCEVMYNILGKIQKTRKILRLVSATRLSGEKGYERMKKLVKILDENDIPFIWSIFTDLSLYNVKPINHKGIRFLKPTYQIWDVVSDSDYGIQLSDTEGYSYFVNECLQYGTPVIVTNFDSVYESVEDGINGYIVNMDLSNLDLDKIYNKIPKGFKYVEKCVKQDWINLLGKPDKKENYVSDIVKVRCIKPYTDMERGVDVEENEIYLVTKTRANFLLEKEVIKKES